jgi:hypothetical protein
MIGMDGVVVDDEIGSAGFSGVVSIIFSGFLSTALARLFSVSDS